MCVIIDVDDKAAETVGKAGRRGRPSAATSSVKEAVTSSQSSTRSSRGRRSSETSVTSEKDSGEVAAAKGILPSQISNLYFRKFIKNGVHTRKINLSFWVMMKYTT